MAPIGRRSGSFLCCFPSELLPPKILSLSEELCPRFPDYYAMPWANMEFADRHRGSTMARRFDIAEAPFRQIGVWVELLWKTGGMKWMDVVVAPEIAKMFIDEVLPAHRDELMILGIGLRRTLLDEFLAASPPSQRSNDRPPAEELALGGEGTYGVAEILSQRGALARDGEVLGYDLAGYGYGAFTSWLVHGLHADCHKRFGIRPNRWGLIETEQDAERCAEFVRAEPGKEPGWWHAWLVLRYPTG